MRKRVLAACLAVLLVCGLVPAAGAAVSSGDAQAYLKAMDNMPNASSYLVDFDGDGSDELLLWDNQSYENKRYEVWDGSRKIASAAMDFVMNDPPESAYYELARSTEAPEQMFFRYHLSFRQDHQIYYTYTIENGEWHRVEDAKWVESYQENMFTTDNHVNDRYFSGQSMADYEVFQQLVAEMNAKYSRTEMLRANHSDRSEVLAALDTTSDGYQDVLNTLSASEKKALFDDFLYCVAGVDTSGIRGDRPFQGFDCRTESDDRIVNLLEALRVDTGFPISDDPFPQAEFTNMTRRYFGRTIDYSNYAIDHQPTYEYYYDTVYYDGVFYLCHPQRGGDVTLGKNLNGTPKQLYSLGDGYYCANFIIQVLSLYGTPVKYPYSAVVKHNADSSWRLVRLYPANYIPTDAELAAIAQPSNWAQAEISAAQAAGLIPELVNDPCWQGKATRLHFAQLAVRLAETATGETLPAAPASTFTDCTDLDVRKAYAAGIVNGTTATTFSPQNKLTREQLATMLWRAVDYIQTRTGESTLTAGGSLTGYTDAGQVSAYAREAVAALAHHSIMQGTGPTTLSPKNDCTVEQSVVLAYRTLEKLG